MSNEFVTVKREVLERIFRGISAELSTDWECNSYHPGLIEAGDLARAALEQPVVDEWNLVHKAVCTAVEQCKNASGMHRQIDLMVNAVQITHDVMGTDTAPKPASKAASDDLVLAVCRALEPSLFKDGLKPLAGDGHQWRAHMAEVERSVREALEAAIAAAPQPPNN